MLTTMAQKIIKLFKNKEYTKIIFYNTAISNRRPVWTEVWSYDIVPHSNTDSSSHAFTFVPSKLRCSELRTV